MAVICNTAGQRYALEKALLYTQHHAPIDCYMWHRRSFSARVKVAVVAGNAPQPDLMCRSMASSDLCMHLAHTIVFTKVSGSSWLCAGQHAVLTILAGTAGQ